MQAHQSVLSCPSDLGFVARGVGYKEDNHGPYVNTAVELYDGGTGRLLSAGKHATVIGALAFTPDGQSIVAGGDEGDLRLWNIS